MSDYDFDLPDQVDQPCKWCRKQIYLCLEGAFNLDGTKHDCMLSGNGETMKICYKCKHLGSKNNIPWCNRDNVSTNGLAPQCNRREK